ncbi:uncharacterized protein LOC131849040 [Achroia grisella]|uniref:uncharacterized protein LOC131849040 n=1 Tax=Achroia grisella TaxID=688607 RepID=UPI0027D2E477|nr:uncharacterized protein LOC131849040 [Achroia grisella]
MAEKRKRSQNYSIYEKDRLVKLLASHKETILNKRTDGSTNEAKNKAWIEVTNAYNSSSTIYRPKDSLMKLWDKMKTESKLYYQSNRCNIIATGGGPSEVKVDPIMEQVCGLLGRGCTGILSVQDKIEEKMENTEECTKENVDPEANRKDVPSTPLWSRRRPQLLHTNERTEAMSSLCNSYTSINKKKESIEDLKRQLLEDEIQFKRKLYELQLQSAAKEVEIKNEVLSQLKGILLILYPD